MNDLSEQISKLANQYDPKREADGRASLKLIEGGMVGLSSELSNFMDIAEVQMPRDEHGNYEDFFVIVTGAGHRIRVSFELESPSE